MTNEKWSEDDFMTRDEVAQYLKVDPSRVSALAKDNKILKVRGPYLKTSVEGYKLKRGSKKGGPYPKTKFQTGDYVTVNSSVTSNQAKLTGKLAKVARVDYDTRIMQDTFEVKFEDNTPCASVFYAHELDLAEVQLQCDICGRYFPGVTKNETICSVCDEDFIAALG